MLVFRFEDGVAGRRDLDRLPLAEQEFHELPALLQVVPGPVAGAYVFVFMVLLFRQGVRLVTAGGFGYERGLIVCISFWVGLGFQFGFLFPDHLPQWSRGILDNGMAAGGIVAVALTLLVSLCSRPRGNAEFWTRVDRKMLWWPGHRQTGRFRVCSPASRRVAALRPRFRGAHGLDAGSAHAVQTCPCLTMPHSRPPRCCGRPSVQIDAVSDDR